MRQAARTGEDMETSRRLSCDEAVRQFSAYLDRALSGKQIDELETHLQACLNCCDRLDFSRKLDRAVKERLGEASLPEGIEERIRRALRG